MRFCLVFQGLLISILCISQSSGPSLGIESKDLFKKIQLSNGCLSIQSSISEIQKLVPIPDFRLKSVQKLRNRILLFENGTGRILELDSLGNIRRIDKTKYSGERFGSFEFVYRDTLFSMGGYGFWHLNGGVKYYNEQSNEWLALRTNKLVKAASGINALFHYDVSEGRVYVISQSYQDEFLYSYQPPERGLYIDVFDLKKKRWGQTFMLSSNIAQSLSEVKVMALGKESLFIHAKSSSSCLELSFKKNACFSMDESFVTLLSQIEAQNPYSLVYSTDKDICFRNLLSDEVVSVNYVNKRLKNLGQLYVNNIETKSIDFSLSFLLAASFLLNGILVSILLYTSVRRKRQTSNNLQQDHISYRRNEVMLGKFDIEQLAFTDILDGIEKSIINIISENRKIGSTTSIDQINKVLGIEKRPYKIQNNIRADALKLINKKFNDYTGTQDELIIRKRSEFDKRFFNYDFNERYASKVMSKQQ